MVGVELNSINRHTNLYTSVLNMCRHQMCTYLVLQVVPEVRPGLFDTSLLLDDGLVDDARQHAESHGHTMVVVAVNRSTSIQRCVLLANNDDAVIKFVGLDTKLGYQVSA